MAQIAERESTSSNRSQFRITEQERLGEIGSNPVWTPYNVAAYNNWGTQVNTGTPRGLRADRQTVKDIKLGESHGGGISLDFNQAEMSTLLQGHMFANRKYKGRAQITAVDASSRQFTFASSQSVTGFITGALVQIQGVDEISANQVHEISAVTGTASFTVNSGSNIATVSNLSGAYAVVVGYRFQIDTCSVSTTGNYASIVSSTTDLNTLGINPGEWIFVGGDGGSNRFDTAANNGFKRVHSVSTTNLVIDKSNLNMVDESTSLYQIEIYTGATLKNQVTDNEIIARCYATERSYEKANTRNPDRQAEYFLDAFPSTYRLQLAAQQIATVDLNYVALNADTRDGSTTQRLYAGTRPDLVTEPPFNSSEDVSRLNMNVVSLTDEAPKGFFGYVQTFDLTVNNNVSPNTAISVTSGFEMNVGEFGASGNTTGYFRDVNTQAAIRANADVTVNSVFVKQRPSGHKYGSVYDLPLVGISGGQPNVAANTAITVPIAFRAGTGSSLGSGFNHILLITEFDYLPQAAR